MILNEPSDRRLAWQPDIYQRYSFLAKLTDILADEGSGGLTVLDVGSGPVALTEAFVSPRFDIVRADVSQFDNPSIVLLHPGEPLPFEDGAFDVAVAMEVLEHVPPAQPVSTFGPRLWCRAAEASQRRPESRQSDQGTGIHRAA